MTSFLQGPSLLQPLIGHLGERWGRLLVALAPAVIAIAMSLLGVAPAYGFLAVLGLALSTTALLMFAFLSLAGWTRVPLLLPLGFASLSVTPVLMAFVQESYPENRALANSLYMGTSFVIRALVVYGVGLLGDRVGIRAAFAVSAGATLLGLPFIYRLPEVAKEG
ncbi:MAG: hypothetical protein ACLFU8_13970 [Anaerolineales bacterium]